MGMLAGLFCYLEDSPSVRAATAVPAKSLVVSLEQALDELHDMEQSVKFMVKLDLEPNYKDLKKKLGSGALGELKRVALIAEDYIGESPTTNIEDEVWSTMMPNSAGRSIKVPFGPNEVLCVVFSCYNDPRQSASTDLLLTKKMLDEVSTTPSHQSPMALIRRLF